MMKGMLTVETGDRVTVHRDNNGVIKAIIVQAPNDSSPPIVECVLCKKLTPTVICTPAHDELGNVGYICYECD